MPDWSPERIEPLGGLSDLGSPEIRPREPKRRRPVAPAASADDQDQPDDEPRHKLDTSA